MADNTVLPLGGAGDTIRTIARTGNSPAKTQVVSLDIGTASDASAESIVSASNPLPAGVLGHAGAIMDASVGAATAPASGLAVISVYDTTPPALTNGQSVALQCDTAGSLYVNKDGRRPTYRATSGPITPVAAATDPIMTLIGSASKTVRVTSLRVFMYSTTGAALPASLTVQRLSSLSGGTPVTHTALPLDSNNAAATAVMSTYTTVPTSTTVVAASDSAPIQDTTTSATAQNVAGVLFTWGDDGGQQFVLRGTSQWLSLLMSTVGTTPIAFITVEWIEDNS